MKSPEQTSVAMVKLSYSIQESTKWPVIPRGEMDTEDRVEVVDLVGRSLVVRKSDPDPENSADS